MVKSDSRNFTLEIDNFNKSIELVTGNLQAKCQGCTPFHLLQPGHLIIMMSDGQTDGQTNNL